MRKFAAPLALVVSVLTMTDAAVAANIVTKQEDWGLLIVPSSKSYGSNFTSPLPLGLTAADYFYEDYSFSVPDASYSSFTATLNAEPFLGITGLEARLYAGKPTMGRPAGAFPQVWTTPVAVGAGAFNLISPVELSAGVWTLQVRGKVTGNAGGSYAGVVNVSPIPEPTTYALLALGLVVIGLSVRRRLPSS